VVRVATLDFPPYVSESLPGNGLASACWLEGLRARV